MNNEQITPDAKNSGWRTLCKRFLCLLLIFASVVCYIPAKVFAEDIWDGTGSGGNGNGSNISGGYWIESTVSV